MADRPLAYVCSPYRGDEAANAARAREYSRQVFEAGYIPITPHIYFSQFLSESILAERAAGMEMGGQLLARCRALVVCGDAISEGMAREIQAAKELRVPAVTLDALRAGLTHREQDRRRERGGIHVFVANPHMRDPMGHVDTMLKLPVTREEFAGALRSIGIGGKHNPQPDYYFHSVQAWDDSLRGHMPRSLDDDGFNELNYLAAKLNGLTEPQREVLLAVMETEWFSGGVKELINLTENLECFDLHSFRNAEQYGEFLATMDGDLFSWASERFAKSKDPNMRELAGYIKRLESHFDAEAFGRERVAEEGGVFTAHGYLRGVEELREIYGGIHDIPAEYRVAIPLERTSERPSVLGQIAAARAERAAAPKKDAPDKPKSCGEER